MARRQASTGAALSFDYSSPELTALAKALRNERDGRRLRAELGASIRKVHEPIRDKARSNIMGMASGGLKKSGPPLRQSIAREVRSEVRLENDKPTARLLAGNSSMPRDFKWAPRRTVANRGWRHPVFGNKDVWVTQYGKRGWFYKPQRDGEKDFRAAILEAVKNMANRIARRG